MPLIISFLILSGFSFLGLSSVTYIFLQYESAILPIKGLLIVSLSPPHPKTIEIFFPCVFKALSELINASGVWAKSTNTLMLLQNDFTNSNLPSTLLILDRTLNIFFHLNHIIWLLQ